MFTGLIKRLLSQAGFEGDDLDLLRHIRDALRITNFDIDFLITTYVLILANIVFAITYRLYFPIWTWLVTSFIPTVIIYFYKKRDDIKGIVVEYSEEDLNN